MCRPKKNNDTPLVKQHNLLSIVYTAHFYSGDAAPITAPPLKSVTRVFNAPIPQNRGAIPKDVSSKSLEAFAPEKAKILHDEKEWKCICCNGGATKYCSSIVGAPSKETVICFKEKVYVACSKEECIAKVIQKKNEDARKLVDADFDFRFSFRSALRPIRADEEDAMKSSLVVPVVETKKKEENEMSAENPITAMEREIKKNAAGIECIDCEPVTKCVRFDMAALKKRKRDDTTRYPSQDLRLDRDIEEEANFKRMKMCAVQKSDGGSEACVEPILGPTTNGTKKEDDGVKENMGTNAKNDGKSKNPPTKVYLKQFPFIYDGEGAWLCRHCLGVPCHAESHHFFAGLQPPPNTFIDRHLILCPVMSKLLPSHV